MSSNRSNELPDKQAVSLAFLEETSVYLHLDPRREGVLVPPTFASQPQLVLQVGLNMPVPITDLCIDATGISCTLSFSRTPHFCVLPWHAIFAIVGENGRGMVWPDDVPTEVAAQVAVERGQKNGPNQKRQVTSLKSVGTKKRSAPKPAPEGPRAKRAPRAAAGLAKSPEASDQGQARAKAPATLPARGAPASRRPLPPYLRVIK